MIVIVLITAAFFIIKSMKVPVIEISNINMEKIENGIYEGEYTDELGLVKAKVEVEVKENKIIDISIIEHKNGLGKKAEKIIDDIISSQSLEVDTISGATLSSNVIRKAIEVAINNKPIK